MRKETKNMMKKTMTKKELRAFYNAFRSPVAAGKKLGTQTMRDGKDYKRMEEKSTIRIPECSCLYACCGDCRFMDTYDSNGYGEYYCGRKRKYYPASDRTCSEYESR